MGRNRDGNYPKSLEVLYPLKEESRRCLKNLALHKAHKKNPYLSKKYPLSRCAAVLVALFVGRLGDLYVLLSRRAETLKSFAGDTSLPGGKYECGDRSPEDTARREAFEEIGLPIDKKRIPLLCTQEPFLSSNNLIVFPVVVLITDRDIKPILNEPEVAAIFSHPLASLLSSNPPFSVQTNGHFTNGPVYHTAHDVQWGSPGTNVRLHKFLTGREDSGLKPIFGLTAAILISTAVIGYGADLIPDYDAVAPNQLIMAERIYYAMTHVPVLVKACEEESIKPRRPNLHKEARRHNATSARSRL